MSDSLKILQGPEEREIVLGRVSRKSVGFSHYSRGGLVVLSLCHITSIVVTGNNQYNLCVDCGEERAFVHYNADTRQGTIRFQT